LIVIPLHLLRLVLIAGISIITAGQIFACKCGSSFHANNGLEVAKLEEQGSDAIFEGTPERFELQWSLLNAKEGDLISAGTSGAASDEWPRMLVTFLVHRAYKGDLEREVQISTGLGGGDCGAVFAPGLTYVVYARGKGPRGLSVSMCSPGGWIGNSTVETELRYLRKKRAIASDLTPHRPWTPAEYADHEEQRHRDFEEFQRRYAAVTGKICGTVLGTETSDSRTGTISFLSTVGYSPVDRPTANVNSDGSFCSNRLGPGKYYLYFTRGSGSGLDSAAYYPGVIDRSKAAAIEISAGQTQSNVTFKVPLQKTYSVRGFISTDDKSGLAARSVSVALISLDEISYRTSYVQTIDFEGSLPLPKVRFLNFENVLPCRYFADASVLGQGWYMKKVEVNVTNHMKFISLQLVHKK
jgi:hypothetical protein